MFVTEKQEESLKFSIVNFNKLMQTNKFSTI